MEREIAEKIYCSIPSSKRTQWVQLLKSNPGIPVSFLENLLQGYRYTHPAALSEVLLGLRNGLSVEDVSTFANPSFTANQMKEIRLGFENIEDRELVFIYLDPKYSEIKMKVCRELLEAGFEKEKVTIYLNTPEYSYNELLEVELGIRHGLSVKELSYYAKREYNCDQMRVLRRAFESGISFKEIHLVAKALFDPEQMEKIANAFIKDKLEIDMVALASRVCFDINQMEEILDGIKLGFSKEQIELYSDPKYSAHRMRIIKVILKEFPESDVLINLLLNSNLDSLRIKMIEEAIYKKYNAEIITFLVKNVDFDIDKLTMLINALDDGISFDTLTKICKYNKKCLPIIIDGLKCGIDISDIEEAEANNLIIEDYINAEIAKKLRSLIFGY